MIPVRVETPLPLGTSVAPSVAPSGMVCRREAAVDLLKGTAIVAVVLHHVANQRFGPGVARAWADVRPLIDWAVYAFLFASGYLHARSSSRGQPTGRFVRGRAVRLLVPYLVISTAYALLAQLIQGVAATGTLTHPVGLGGKLATILRGDPTYGEQMYFFPLLFVVSVGFQLMWAAGGRADRPAWIAAAAAAGVAALTFGGRHPLATTGWSVDMVVSGLLQYAIGFLVGSGRPGSPRPKAVAAAVTAGCAAAAGGAWDWRFAMVPVPLLAFAMLGRVRRPWRPVLVVGAASGTIFAYHTPLVLQTLLIGLFWLHVPVGLDIAASTVLAIALCVGLHWALGRSAATRWARI